MKIVLFVMIVLAAGCSSKGGTYYGGGGYLYHDWHQRVYEMCSQSNDPWACAIENHIAL